MMTLSVHNTIEVISESSDKNGMFGKITHIPGSDEENQKIEVILSRIYGEIITENDDGVFYFDKEELRKVSGEEPIKIDKKLICQLLFKDKEWPIECSFLENPLIIGLTECMHGDCHKDAYHTIFVMHTNHTVYEFHVCEKHAYYNGMHTEIPCKKIRPS